jgi:hypothetical protein
MPSASIYPPWLGSEEMGARLAMHEQFRIKLADCTSKFICQPWAEATQDNGTMILRRIGWCTR